MSDLTDADLEAMEKRCALVKRAKYLPVRESLIITTEDIEQMTREDLPALIAALREARGEREEARKALDENRLLRDLLAQVVDGDDVISEAAVVLYSDEGKAIALTAAEAERVRRMERVWHTLNSIEDETDGVCPMCGSEWGCNIDCTFCTLAALAVLRKGESCQS